MAGIYLHIPFCKQACYYCDFHFSTNLGAKDEMVKAIGSELQLQRDYLQEPVNTIYFGGGTPSLLDANELQFLMDQIRSGFNLATDLEVTLEANPDDLTVHKLHELKQAGINRLSVGIQSFDDDLLKFLHRAHDSLAALSCIRDARVAGFNNISIDLIYAIPGLNENQWKENLEKAIALQPEHISAYSLTIEEKTVFGNWSKKGKIKPVEEELSAVHLEMLVGNLKQGGYEQYEISNFSKPGFHSRHNSSYWKQIPYLGVGPSAHSFNGRTRQANISSNYEYLRSLAKGIIPASVEILTPEDQVNDYLLTTLRTSWGTDMAKLKREFGYDLQSHYRAYIESLQVQKLAVITNDHLVLTEKGRLLADKISTDLFVTSLS